MKTYIAIIKENNYLSFRALESENMIEAKKTIKKKGLKLHSIHLSAVSIDYVSCPNI